MDNYFNNATLLKVIFKWKWHIVAVTIIAALLGALFSGPMFITPKFKSEAVLYPNGLSEFSDETYTEQMLQVMESQEIMDSVVEKFDLMNHYEIDKNYKYAKTALIGEYRDRISISKTPYDAVKIKVLDKDPQIAYNIVNEIINQYNIKFGEIHKSKKYENARMFEQQLAKKYAFIDSLKRELTKITNDGDMLNYLYLSKGNSIAYFSDGNDSKKTGNVATAIALVELIATETADYTDVRHFYEEELRQAEGNMTYSNIISRPYISDKKAYPVRWVIVALCGIGALLMSILTVAAIEKIETKE
jgi:capsular polysaccharide biosynthesis protein